MDDAGFGESVPSSSVDLGRNTKHKLPWSIIAGLKQSQGAQQPMFEGLICYCPTLCCLELPGSIVRGVQASFRPYISVFQGKCHDPTRGRG